MSKVFWYYSANVPITVSLNTGLIIAKKVKIKVVHSTVSSAAGIVIKGVNFNFENNINSNILMVGETNGNDSPWYDCNINSANLQLTVTNFDGTILDAADYVGICLEFA
jgi:hypothetical protein